MATTPMSCFSCIRRVLVGGICDDLHRARGHCLDRKHAVSTAGYIYIYCKYCIYIYNWILIEYRSCVWRKGLTDVTCHRILTKNAKFANNFLTQHPHAIFVCGKVGNEVSTETGLIFTNSVFHGREDGYIYRLDYIKRQREIYIVKSQKMHFFVRGWVITRCPSNLMATIASRSRKLNITPKSLMNSVSLVSISIATKFARTSVGVV